MAVEALVDAPVHALLDALQQLRDTPAPVGLEAARVGLLAHASAELRGVFLRDLAAVEPAASGARNRADLLVETAGLPVWQARKDAALAERLAVVPGLAVAVAEGGVAVEAGLQLVRAWRALPARLHQPELAQALLTLAQLVDLRDLRAKVDELVGALLPDVTDADLADARESAELTLVDVGARTRLQGECDAVTGELLRDVLRARAEADRGLDDGRSSARRAMDALVSCVTAAATGVPGEPQLVVVTTVDDLAATAEAVPDCPRPDDAVADLFAGTDLLAHSTTSPVARPSWGTRTRGGLPLGPRTLAALACSSVLTRLVLSPLGAPVDSSPEARQLSRRERRALEHRAGYRCERSGCGRSAAVCVPHHVVPWALGGPSTLDNTVLLCVSCHHLLHDRRRGLHLTSGRRIGPRGWLDPAPGDLLRPGPLP